MIDWMKAASRPESGQGKHLFALRLSRSTPFLAYLLIFACVLSLALIPGPRESSASAVHSSPRASWAGASSAVLRPFSCPSQTKQRVAQACSGKLDGKKGAASAACSLADLSSSESEIKVSHTLIRHEFVLIRFASLIPRRCKSLQSSNQPSRRVRSSSC